MTTAAEARRHIQKEVDAANEILARARKEGIVPTTERASSGWFSRHKTSIAAVGGVAVGAVVTYGVQTQMKKRTAQKLLGSM